MNLKPIIGVLSKHIEAAIVRAVASESFLHPDVLKINGFATPTMRHLFSNLCHSVDCSYLEVGTFCGATFVAAFNKNPIYAVGIDNFTQPFEQTGVREQLQVNVDLWRYTAKDVQFLDGDCFALNPLDQQTLRLHRPFDIYYYDGEHSYQNQARALPAFFELLADRFIYIVDDYQWDSVRLGTQTGFDVLQSRLKIENVWHLNGERMHDDPVWWNGMAIFLCSKVKAA